MQASLQCRLERKGGNSKRHSEMRITTCRRIASFHLFNHSCRTIQVSFSSVPVVVSAEGAAHAPTIAQGPTVADGSPAPTSTQRKGKRMIALHFGYIGTDYLGLQKQASELTTDASTLETALEGAIYNIGGILDSNRGNLGRLRWSRSSRTDKQVHSLATVIGMKLECDPASFESDPEGIDLANQINSHLPRQLRVFSLQRAPKSFNARMLCDQRTYDYYLPASLLPQPHNDSLKLLEAAWKLYEGTHPFHCYTTRRLYRGDHGKQKKGKQTAVIEQEDEEEEEHEIIDDGMPLPDMEDITRNTSITPAPHQTTLSSSSLPLRKVSLEWKGTPDTSDLVTPRHYRTMRLMECSPEIISLGTDSNCGSGTASVPCVKLSVTGSSFMIRQIRHMVGGAVAVARGEISLELLEASMAIPARISSLPLAPPSTLMLAGNTFRPFRRSWDGRLARSADTTGEVLMLRERGVEEREMFWREQLMPAVGQLLRGEEWESWESDLGRRYVDEGEVEVFVGMYREWIAAKKEREREEMMTGKRVKKVLE